MPKRTPKKVNTKQAVAIAYSAVLGLEIKTAHPEIAQLFRNGKSLAYIANLCSQDGFSHIDSAPVLEHAVQFALHGNNNEGVHPEYPGLIPHDEYHRLSAQHRESVRSTLGTRVMKAGTGLYRLTHDQLAEASKHAAIARGQVPWSDGEIWFAYMLGREDEYRWLGKVSHTKIARTLNEYWHNGKKIRDKSKVSNMFHRQKKYWPNHKSATS